MTTDDEARFEEFARELCAAIDDAIESWVLGAVTERLGQMPPAVHEQAKKAAKKARVDIGAELRHMLDADVDAQRGNPLAVLRTAVAYPTEVLVDAGLPAVNRDQDARRLHPDDLYDLTPGAFGDFGPAVHEAGLKWGAAKAHLHLQRRRAEGQR